MQTSVYPFLSLALALHLLFSVSVVVLAVVFGFQVWKVVNQRRERGHSNGVSAWGPVQSQSRLSRLPFLQDASNGPYSLTLSSSRSCLWISLMLGLLVSAPTLCKSQIVAIASSPVSSHTCALTAAGTAWCWGYNCCGQLGDGASVNGNIPVAVSVLPSGAVVTAIATGDYHTCVIVNGTVASVYCFGYGVTGQLGACHVMGDLIIVFACVIA